MKKGDLVYIESQDTVFYCNIPLRCPTTDPRTILATNYNNYFGAEVENGQPASNEEIASIEDIWLVYKYSKPVHKNFVT